MSYGAALFFLLLPLGLVFWRAHRRPRFSFAHVLGGKTGRVEATRLVAIAVLLVPLSLALIAEGVVSTRWLMDGFSVLGALAGAYTLGGKRAVPLVALPVAASWTLGGDWGLLGFDLVALAAALGAGELLADLLRGKEPLFLTALAAVDCVVVLAGEPQSVVAKAATAWPAFLGPAPDLALHPPVYAGLAVDGVFLGAIDLACAVIVGGYLRRHRTHARKRALATYVVAQTAMIVFGLLTGRAFPATVPPLLAIAATYHPDDLRRLVARARHRRTSEPTATLASSPAATTVVSPPLHGDVAVAERLP